MQEIYNLARMVTDRLSHVSGVQAVLLAASTSDQDWTYDADVDLYVYYSKEALPPRNDLRKVAVELNPSHPVDDEMEFDVATSTGTLLWVEGRRIGLHYREIERVQRAIDQVKYGIFTSEYQPAGPHGFFSFYLVGEVAQGHPLYDSSGQIEAMRAEAVQYPPALRHSVFEMFSREADIALFNAQRSASEDDLFFATGYLYRCAACLVQAVFAMNGIYYTGAPGVLRKMSGLEQRPERFEQVLTTVLSVPGRTRTDLFESIDELRSLLNDLKMVYFSLPDA